MPGAKVMLILIFIYDDDWYRQGKTTLLMKIFFCHQEQTVQPVAALRKTGSAVQVLVNLINVGDHDDDVP